MRPLPLLLPSLALVTVALQPVAQAQAERFIEAHSMFPAYESRPAAIAGADVDGDGDRDVLIAGTSFHKRLALNDGTGAFQDATAKLGPQFLNDDCVDVALADVDGDGDADAVFANGHSNLTRLLLNSGDGTFTTAFYFTAFSQCIALGDVNGDGAPDAVLGTSAGPNQLWLNDGTGLFVEAGLPLTGGGPEEVLLPDVDGDGDLDVIFAGSYDFLLQNQGSGTFSEAVGAIPSPTTSATRAAEYGDVDADGDVDLMTVTHNQPLLYLNGGAGFFAYSSDAFPPTASHFWDAALRDFDGDGHLDALLVHSGSVFFPTDVDYLFVNDGGGVFEDASELLPEVAHDTCTLYADDLDGDGDADVLLGLGHQNRVCLNDGAGGLHDATSDWPLEGLVTSDVALGDVDADGDLDALVASRASATSLLYLNDGRGDFDDVTAGLGLALQGAEVGLLGDVNGDGADDVLLCSTADSLHLADGQGGLLPASPGFPVDGTSKVDAAFVDSDSDGDLDALLVTYTKARHYRNDGAGGFTYSATDTPASLPSPKCIAVGDVDGDGDLDALIGIGPFGDDVDKLLLNDGAGVFSTAVGAVPVFDDDTEGVALTDVDGDGDLDALIANDYGLLSDRLYKNGGSGIFTDASSQLPPDSSLGPAEVVAADFDEDGDADVLGAGAFWTNGGAGFFSDATSAMPWAPYEGGKSNALAVGDVDGDDDLDVVAGTGDIDFESAHDRLYTNVSRQVSRTTLPRVGKPYTLALHGDPFSAFFFAWGSTPAQIPLPPFGILRLDPGGLLVIDSSGLIPPTGPVLKTFQAPSDPFWVGVTIYWQALLGTPLRFTNLEATTLSAL